MSRKYRAEQDICISGYDFEIELTLVVNFTVHPGCKQTLTSPAEVATAEIESVQFFDGEDEKILPLSIEDRITGSDGFKSWLMQEAAEDEEYRREQAADARREERWLEDRT